MNNPFGVCVCVCVSWTHFPEFKYIDYTIAWNGNGTSIVSRTVRRIGSRCGIARQSMEYLDPRFGQ